MSAAISLSRLKARAIELSSRENISAASFALAITFALADPIILSANFFYYLLFIGIGFKYATIKKSWGIIATLSTVIVVSGFIAVPFSLFAESRLPAATVFNASLVLILFLFMFLQNIERLFYTLTPAWFLQAGVMAWQWFVEDVDRAGGIARNANAGSAFLLLGAIFLLHQPRLKWLAVPLLAIMPMSGSRWVMVVAAVVLSMVFIAKHLRWRWVAIGISAAFLVLLLTQHSQLLNAFLSSRGTSDGTAIERQGKDALWRLTPASSLAFPSILIPQGFINSQLHSLPVRMASETGLLSALAWLGVGAATLYRKPRIGWAWWCMVAVCLLSAMYYFTWIGPLGAFWWLLAGELMRKQCKPQDHTWDTLGEIPLK